MTLLIFYVWTIDLFFYSNTEIFIIFFIFSSFGIFFYNIVIWYTEYMDQLIVSENKSLYLIIFSLQKKFISLRERVNRNIMPNKVYISYPLTTKKLGEIRMRNFFKNFYLFSEIIFYINLYKFYFFRYKNYVTYLNVLLFRVYTFELQRNRNFVNSKFFTLKDNLLGNKLLF